MQVNKEKAEKLRVFVSGKFATHGIYEDMVLPVGADRFKSTKFRHTYYSASDFYYSKEEAEQFIKEKYKLS